MVVVAVVVVVVVSAAVVVMETRDGVFGLAKQRHRLVFEGEERLHCRAGHGFSLPGSDS
jgi:hypothetical protein